MVVYRTKPVGEVPNALNVENLVGKRVGLCSKMAGRYRW
jgi:hypothetical protein